MLTGFGLTAQGAFSIRDRNNFILSTEDELNLQTKTNGRHWRKTEERGLKTEEERFALIPGINLDIRKKEVKQEVRGAFGGARRGEGYSLTQSDLRDELCASPAGGGN